MANFLVDHEYTLDITPSARPQLVHVSEYDVGRRFTFTITQGGEEFIGLTPSVGDVTVEGTIGSYAFSEPASIENGKIVFQLTESMTAHAGKAWTKIKFANADAPISTCAFFLVVDRAGVEAETVIGADGFEQQIVNAVNDWLDEHPPASGGMTEEIKQALLACFENVAWIDADGQDYCDALEAALYPSKTLVSISAAFNQGSAVIYDTDSLDTLKQYLTVTATYDDASTGVVTDYTLSGTLTAGTSTITVTYSGKTTTFNATVTQAIPDTTAQIASEGKILTHHTGVPYFRESDATNGGITIKYQMDSPSTTLFPAGIIPTDAVTSMVTTTSAACLVIYDQNGDEVSYVNELGTSSFNRWVQNVTGTMTEFSQSWSVGEYTQMAFSVDVRYVDDAYMYDKTTGQVWFAGRNTPYFGMSNISEAG